MVPLRSVHRTGIPSRISLFGSDTGDMQSFFSFASSLALFHAAALLRAPLHAHVAVVVAAAVAVVVVVVVDVVLGLPAAALSQCPPQLPKPARLRPCWSITSFTSSSSSSRRLSFLSSCLSFPCIVDFFFFFFFFNNKTVFIKKKLFYKSVFFFF